MINRRRNVLWESYLLDRFSSSTLGQPFTIDDALIQVDVHQPVPPSSGTSVFNWLVGMGGLSSEIDLAMDERRAALGRLPKYTASPDSLLEHGETLRLLRTSHAKLNSWRKAAPFIRGTNCLFEAPEFFEMTYQEERLRLIRVAIGLLASARHYPPKLCYGHAHMLRAQSSRPLLLSMKASSSCSPEHTHTVYGPETISAEAFSYVAPDATAAS
ncbi:hypothetical protein B0I35DRAFT_517479 [Stachybotrys elegans]|uniref:Transcription factor domain-containing protein n=1 Tax=Stachybotrys elegans TaxID=80388 RepID=A0A8K0WIR5_9HYPO|nr:hypothetical protein B0I35DRAFT_517479 [Stachybotrys elegans]